MVTDLERLFPRLQGANYQITSPKEARYNCIAWAAGDTERWWEPSEKYYWPPGIPLCDSLDSYVQAFATLGYSPCSGDASEPGFEKIAIFVDSNGMPTHATRQLVNGRWTSKLGQLEDIEHALDDLVGEVYGKVGQILKRPQPAETSSGKDETVVP
jgi:hypothetical protein